MNLKAIQTFLYLGMIYKLTLKNKHKVININNYKLINLTTLCAS